MPPYDQHICLLCFEESCSKDLPTFSSAIYDLSEDFSYNAITYQWGDSDAEGSHYQWRSVPDSKKSMSFFRT